MNIRDANILDAAIRVFTRYGLSRSTMNDIAREAGVARQTLYNAYPNKEEVLRAAARKSIQESIDEVRSAWETTPGLEAKLVQFTEIVPLKWWDMVQASPDIAELVDGLHNVARQELDEAAALWCGEFEDLLAEDAPNVANRAQIADYFYASAINAKLGVKDRGTLEMRLKILIASVMALISQA